jgi:xanthine/CO dehydrogenase XdhC/CoxF family maturation factor
VWPRLQLVTYGVTKEEAARFGLPCGGNLRLVQEPLQDSGVDRRGAGAHRRHELVARRLDFDTGAVTIEARPRAARPLHFTGRTAARPVRPALAPADHRRRPTQPRAGADGAGAGL